MASVGELTPPSLREAALQDYNAANASYDVERRRVSALRAFSVLDTPSEPAFDELAQLAARICDTPMALVSFVDEHRQWFKAKVGLDVDETSRDVAFCSHAICTPKEVFVVGDTLRDSRFCNNDLVAGYPSLRFYAGAPIVVDDGAAVGTVCALDQRPRTLSGAQLQALRDLARQAASLLEARRASFGTQPMPRLELFASALAEIDPTVALSLDGRILAVNERFRRCYPAQGALIGRAIEEHFAAEPFAASLTAAKGGASVEHEGVLGHPVTGARYVRMSLAPVRAGGSAVTAVVVRITDLHALKEQAAQHEQELERAVAHGVAQQRFVRMIAHDVREPINTICNFSQLVARRFSPELGEQATKYLTFINEGGLRIRTMVEDLLTLVRLDGAPVRRIEVGLVELVRAATSDLTAAIERTGAQVTIDDLPTVFADATLVRVVMQNLIGNALKFQRPGVTPQVTVRGALDGEGWQLAVTDNGIGISAEHTASLFVEFRRLHSRREYDGTGLGLAICQRIAELHGGRIEVRSTIGVGSTFTLIVPHSR